MADYYYRRVTDILDDKATEDLDVLTISESSMPRYIESISSLKKAAALSPARSQYPKALEELYSKLGRWAGTMEALKTSLPSGALSKKEAFDNAMTNIRKAVSLEPTNPDYHLVLGQLYDTVYGDALGAEAELRMALEAFPINAPLRYSVAMHYLLTGRQGEALEQARLLAGIDDSYILDNDDPARKKFMIERRTDSYLSMLYNSYLFKALEITWRISKDPHATMGIAPDTADAREVVQAFMEWKGIEEKE
jgi:tetratricopeptide (TPR) repeat protein